MEVYTVYESRTCLEFDQKDPDGTQQYLVDFAPLLNAEESFSDSSPIGVEVEIEAAGIAESPLALTVTGVAAVPGVTPTGSPSANTAASFWLEGGTDATRYQGKITVTTDGEGQNQTFIKRFLIVVEGYTQFGSPDDEKGSPTMSPHHRWDEPQW